MAGLGGAVYLVQKFSVAYAYGYKNSEGKKYLQGREIIRYLLVALSAVILGPIAMALAMGGAIPFNGFAAGKQIPMFTAVGFSFLLGFAYHDTLKALVRLSEKYLGKEKKEKQEEDCRQPAKDSDKPGESDERAEAKKAGA